MASAAEQLASNLNFSAFSKAEDLKKRIWFTLGALLVYRLGTYIPTAKWWYPWAVQHVCRRCCRAYGDLRTGHHALHLCIHYHAVDDFGCSHAGAIEKGWRTGSQGHQPVYPLRHGAFGDHASLRYFRRAGVRQWYRCRSRLVFPYLDRCNAGRRHNVPSSRVLWQLCRAPLPGPWNSDGPVHFRPA